MLTTGNYYFKVLTTGNYYFKVLSTGNYYFKTTGNYYFKVLTTGNYYFKVLIKPGDETSGSGGHMMVGMDNKRLILLTESINLSCVPVLQVNIAIRLNTKL